MSSEKFKNQTVYIMDMIKALDYPGILDVEDEWIAKMIYEPSSSRFRLLKWLLKQLLPSDIDSDNFNNNEIFSTLSSLGICSESDAASLVEGTAPPGRQAAFWKLFLEVVTQRQSLSRLNNDYDLQNRNETLLHTLCRSNFVEKITTFGGSSILPQDLQNEYKHRKLEIQSPPKELESLQNELDSLSNCNISMEPMEESHRVGLPFKSSLLSNVEKLNNVGLLFSQNFENHFAPHLGEERTKISYSAESVIPETYSSLQSLSKAISRTRETEQMKTISMKSETEPNRICETVKSLSILAADAQQ